MKFFQRFGLAIALLAVTTTVLATRSYTDGNLSVSDAPPYSYQTLLGFGDLTTSLTTEWNGNPQCRVTDASRITYYLFFNSDGVYRPVYPDGSW